MLHVRFQCEQYQAPVVFVSDCPADKVNKILKTKYDIDGECLSNEAGMVQSFICKKEDNTEFTVYVIWVEGIQDIEALVHECIHLASYILQDRGIDVTSSNMETLAYYHGYLFKTLWNEMVCFVERKAKRRKNKKCQTK